jgi:hypothetical protein
MTRFVLAGVAALAAAVSMSAPAQAQARVKVGTLACEMSGGVGMVVTSRKELLCHFSPTVRGWRGETYVGSITRVGLDLGATTGGRLLWGVYAPTRAERYALAGAYGGASAEATVGGGLGANVLLGGNNRTVALQPLSVQGQTGLNVAAGIAGLELQPAQPARPARRR